ncbi:1,4-alpha-glucan branching protein GlgB [Pseudomonas haemolytica]|uniref:1,4-alpha-glucan branching enzyme GlgB n=1 Tax=Pseudomonas haemolytica TaxID=2600065 RepID=A0A5P1DFP1_9PSED|nr:1,4-alpha-glucan branching protein GlgB [Pseudomonas haemolytica]MBJ2248389.1 1,4-alpha-glucan branching protein GlgB [Pseudomonas haemolytica]MBJ2275714.1 1,4-alpha-glucan branching protein GlgB [Pseudomonas haemolytica]MBK3451347.1 1,4-alpha-glucan branching protein GlgB [Pseudomonas haemolytica]MBK3459796.1 1,4-alpha-glucan branching protein GlgB [Pseudomonas haemolytica]MRJ39202.1 1,4-alpha-glucan branching protein GlgB [Pseudomonas haemolytica]
MSFTHKEPLQPKLTALPASKDVEALVRAEHPDPFSILGPHDDEQGGQFIRAFVPEALSVQVLSRDGNETLGSLEATQVPGLFVGQFSTRQPYLLKIQWAGGEQITEDPYSFSQLLLGEMDLYLFAEGNHRDLGSCLGAQVTSLDGVEGVRFAVWAPNARRVSVVGDFNIWDGRRHPMRLRHPSGVWEIFIPRLQPGAAYKYEILGAHGILPLKADPMALATQLPPDTASKVAAPLQVDWQDHEWMQARGDKQKTTAPLSIYELHVGSWQCELDEAGEVARQYGWRELAERLIPYVQELGFTHIELMPIMEHPFGGSWGYQALSQFAPSARFGSPQDFAWFVNACHQADIGVILDWVPAHFPTDTHGLAQFDGTALYEYANPLEGFHQDWDTLIYNLGRTEVHGFMLASALHWLKHFHIDGLRVDAVASMLYRDYSRKAGEWVPNRHGGRENLEAIDFLRHLNDVVALEAPGALVIAEESTAWPGVSQPTQQGGLGFNYKWNMGWMHDSLHYIQQDPVYRAHHHNELSFGLVYAWSERFILPISHDEVVHGKHSLIDKMPGDRWQKFANLRAYLSFMWMHPGKKLLFMGCEFGQWREWNHDQQLDWYLLQYPEHRGVQKLVGDLNRLYREEPALHEQDDAPQGFQWLIGDDAINSVYAWLRWSKDGQPVLVVANFTPVPREGYAVGVPFGGRWSEVINSDADTYAGSNYGNGGEVFAQDEPRHGQPASLSLNLPPLGVLILRPQVL